MEHVLPTDVLAHDRLIIEISILARRYAGYLVRREEADDLAQHVVLICLERMHSGRWRTPRCLPAFIRVLVRRTRAFICREDVRRARRDEEHARALREDTPLWMAPDSMTELAELDSFQGRTAAGLSPARRRAYQLVREELVPYEVAARQMGVSRGTVSAHVVAAERRVRKQLADAGVVAPPVTARRSGKTAGHAGQRTRPASETQRRSGE